MNPTIWHIIYSILLSIVTFLVGISYKLVRDRFNDLVSLQKNNETRHYKFVAAVMSLMVELHPQQCELITKSFKDLLQ